MHFFQNFPKQKISNQKGQKMLLRGWSTQLWIFSILGLLSGFFTLEKTRKMPKMPGKCSSRAGQLREMGEFDFRGFLGLFFAFKISQPKGPENAPSGLEH